MGKKKTKTTVLVRINMDSKIHRRLKVTAAGEDVTITSMVERLLDKHLPKGVIR